MSLPKVYNSEHSWQKKAKTSPSPAPTQVKKPSPVQLLDSSDEESQDHLEPVTDTSKQRTQSKSEKAATVGVMKTSVKSSRAQKLLMDLLEESGRAEDVKKKGGARPGGKPERRNSVKKRSQDISKMPVPKIPGKTKGRTGSLAQGGGQGDRVMEVKSSGIMLPDGPGLQDPCEREEVDVFEHLSPQQREDVTSAAQTEIRNIHYRKINRTLGMEDRGRRKEEKEQEQEKEEDRVASNQQSLIP